MIDWRQFGVGLKNRMQPVAPFGPDNPSVATPTPGAPPSGPEGPNPFPDYFRPEPQHTAHPDAGKHPMAAVDANQGRGGDFNPAAAGPMVTSTRMPPPPAPAPVAEAPPPPSPPSPPMHLQGPPTPPPRQSPFASASPGFDTQGFFDNASRFGS